ncbi:MAG TPA: hypothetical protein VFE22_15390, partial [Edaphobacter sp.]|nr:hypothetical protein [Edaphobacter sp.]
VEGKIRVAAPHLRFVTGHALERLHNGAPVPFAIQLALSTDRWLTVAQRDIERFVVSYDLWEEKFSISKLGSPHKAVSHLNTRAVEAWCLDEMAVLPAAAPQQPFWLRLEVRAENPGDADAPLLTEEGVSLTRLVEMFSRRTRNEQTRWVAESGPFRMAGLMRGARGGGGQ